MYTNQFSPKSAKHLRISANMGKDKNLLNSNKLFLSPVAIGKMLKDLFHVCVVFLIQK